MVVIHEAYGLNDNIRDMCRQLADKGYTALGVDLFAGRNRPILIDPPLLGAMPLAAVASARVDRDQGRDTHPDILCLLCTGNVDP